MSAADGNCASVWIVCMWDWRWAEISTRARPVQGLLRFLGMLAKDDRKINMEQAQYFLFLLTRRASIGPSPVPLFLSKECPAVADLHCFHSHTVRLGSAWRRCPLDTD